MNGKLVKFAFSPQMFSWAIYAVFVLNKLKKNPLSKKVEVGQSWRDFFHKIFSVLYLKTCLSTAHRAVETRWFVVILTGKRKGQY